MVEVEVTVTTAVPCFVGSAADVAEIVTDPALAGAVSRPVEEIVPPLVDQFTDWSKFPVPVTVAAHCTVPPTATVVDEQETLTPVMVEVEVTVTTAVPCFVGSAADVAEIVTDPALAGAVSRPVEEIVPPLVDQFTALLNAPVPVTMTEHCSAWPAATVVAEQDTLTPEMVGAGSFGGVVEEPPPQAAKLSRSPTMPTNAPVSTEWVLRVFTD